MASQLKVQRGIGQELEVKVIDNEDVEHDITAKFRSISGATTPAGFSNQFQGQDDGTMLDITFTALGKELTFDVDATTLKQLLALV